MTTTMGDIVNGALKRLRVINPRREPDAISASDGLTALNDMMHSWKANGVDIAHTTLERTDAFPLDPEHVQGVKALLAVKLSGDYGMELTPAVIRDADLGWSGIMTEFVEPADQATFDNGLLRIGLGRCM